nr:VanZ family protein [uncultured Flavobacterium sp.]
MSNVPKVSVLEKDKYIHSFFYFVFSVLWFQFLSKKKPEWSFAGNAIIIIVFAFLYGGAIEICQEVFTATRTADVNDLLANVAGSIIGITAVLIVEKFRKRELN